MAFVVEDGTGLENATALASVEFVDDYFSLRGNAEWSGTVQEKQTKIILATDYIVIRFGCRIKGVKKNEDQSLPFPLDGQDSVPEAIKKACAEYALRAVADLMPDPVYDESGMLVASKSEKTGPLAEAVTFRENGKPLTFRKYPLPDSLMIPFLTQTGSTVIR